MARRRLTRSTRTAADDHTPYPGSVNQEGRFEDELTSMSYRTFEPSVDNHEGQDLRHVAENDDHNDIGFGIPDPASGMLITASEYQQKCLKATELAECFLGEKVSDRMLLAQARDFLSLDNESLDRGLERFNRTESLYATADEEVLDAGAGCMADEDCDDDTMVAADEEEMDDMGGDEMTVEPDAPAEEMPAEAPAEEMPAEAPAETPAIKGIEETPVAPAVEDHISISPDNPPALQVPPQPDGPGSAQAPTAVNSDAPVPAEMAASLQGEDGSIELASEDTIDFSGFSFNTSFSDAPLTANAADDAELSTLFGDPMADAAMGYVPPHVAAAQQEAMQEASKMGVQSIGGGNVPTPQQDVRTASTKDELGSLWKDAPDINGWM